MCKVMTADGVLLAPDCASDANGKYVVTDDVQNGTALPESLICRGTPAAAARRCREFCNDQGFNNGRCDKGGNQTICFCF